MRHLSHKCVAFVLITALIILTFCMPSSAMPSDSSLQKLTGKEYITVKENSLLKLCLQPDTGDFYVEELATGNKTYSSPVDAQADPLAKGYNLMTLQSAFEITYISKNQVTDMTNSLVSSVRKNGLSVYKTAGGAKLVFELPEIGITIPIAIELLEDSIEVSVIVTEIKEEGDYKLLTLTLYPFLGAAAYDKSGSVVLPDGCGALIDFEAGMASTTTDTYRKAVYGGNAINAAVSVASETGTLQLPVFGISTDTSGILGIITKGDSLSDIEVYYKGSKNSYTAVHPIFRYRGTTTRTLFDSSWDRKKVTIVADQSSKLEAYTVRYYTMQNADYVAMAKKVAEYYGSNEKERKSAEATVSVRIPAAARKADSILGIPVKSVFAINDYSAVSAVADKLQSAGINKLNVFYAGAFSGGLYDAMPVSAKPERKLGSKKELKELLSKLEESGAALYPEADLSRIYKSGNGVWQRLNASHDFSGGVKELSDYSPVTTYAATVDPLKYTVLCAAKYDKVYSKFVKGLNKYGFKGFIDVGTDALASDNPHGKNATDCYAAQVLQRDAVANASAKCENYIVKNAAAYLLPFVTGITDAPYVSSRMDGFSREIPFYSLVAGEFAGIWATEINDIENTDVYLLRCLEQGLLPAAYISLKDTSVLSETAADGFFAADADSVTERLSQLIKKAGGALDIIAENALSDHTSKDGVFISTYADGTRIYGNYNDRAVTADGVNIEANSFTVCLKGE